MFQVSRFDSMVSEDLKHQTWNLKPWAKALHDVRVADLRFANSRPSEGGQQGLVAMIPR